MSMLAIAIPWNEGEMRMHELLKIPLHDNPTAGMLTQQAILMFERAPLLAIGTLDSEGYPWTSLWGGETGFSEPLGSGIVGTRTSVDSTWDPVVQALVGHAKKGEMVKGNEKMVSGLSFNLMTRKRVKIFGRVLAGTIDELDVENKDKREPSPTKQHQIQLVTRIEQSMGNCPKYINQYEIKPATVTSNLAYEGPALSVEAKTLILGSDMFFLSSATGQDMDTNIRGGPRGFVRVISDTEIAYPEYSGNRLYQSLGNLKVNPKIGMTFPNYETGDVLYTTGVSEVLTGNDAAALLPGSNLALKITFKLVRLVKGGLPFRGDRREPSPYNPIVRTLASEGNIKSTLSSRKSLQLIRKTILTPTVGRFTFSVPEGVEYSPGQWAAFDFSGHLDQGYSHMRNDDPRSLNDDFVRTFTISSTPNTNESEKEFDITIRNVGVVTNFLFQQNDRAGFEVPLVGVGGEFKIEQRAEDQMPTPFIAGGGVGITPLLGQLEGLNKSPDRLKLLWTLRLSDVGLALDVLKKSPELAKCTVLFFTGSNSGTADTEKVLAELAELGAEIVKRRISKLDIDAVAAKTWYLCAGNPLRKELLAWLEGKTVVFENFDY
ncbi:hypothetical protein DM02DRAFT_655065 [Periconia macrospinosa]|uniref:FAD-binding FR-type domain-containing protein n=1 Tax=Periconia macrospinosa TaxID=97972 RepID=A0A2V1DVH2_9PLEO|nr:hypothetical protein DM02DRAFT_655065 [Periconia macrospinosa]